MPPRNLYLILLVAVVSLACHLEAEQNRSAAAIADAMELIDRYYVDDVDKSKLIEAAMAGLTSGLDPYTAYIPPGSYESFQSALQQEFAGIGVLVEQPDPKKPTRVITPLVGSPAMRAGFLPGDEIVQVAGTDTSMMPLSGVSDLLRGPVGSEVRVMVRRRLAAATSGHTTKHGPVAEETLSEEKAPPAEEAPEAQEIPQAEETTEAEEAAEQAAEEPAATEVELTVERANIQLESVQGDHRDGENRWVYRLEDHPKIAYIRLTGFGERTSGELSDVLKRLDNRFEGLILDLRGNAGGLLGSAVEVCDMFLNSGQIVSTRGRGVLDPDVKDFASIEDATWKATPGTAVIPSLPLVVLVDGESASASEIVAACLKDHGRATVVGSRTFGKGSVQNVFPLQSGRSALKLTTARYYRPNGHNIHRDVDDTEDEEWGVQPTGGYEVPLNQEQRTAVIRRWEMATYPSFAQANPQADPASDVQGHVDPQLTRAVEAIRD